jgi:hypothetical protein
VPQLVANGEIRIGDQVRSIADVPAYHDHNWFGLRWGDFLWQWGAGIGHPGCTPWSIVFTRILDRSRLVETARNVLIWRGGRLARTFRDESISCSVRGFQRMASLTKLPPVMAMVAPELDTDIPQRIDLTAQQGLDRLRLRLTIDRAAQILVPHETDLGTTAINECIGRMEADGVVDGEPLHLDVPCIFEHLTAQDLGAGRQ